jgi:DNA-binding NarL/FixJ family response regulator
MNNLKKQIKEQPETVNYGSKWTEEEESRLLKSIRDGKTIDDIANEHKRTPLGISYRLRHIFIHMIEDDKISIKEVATILTISVDDIILEQKRRNFNKNIKEQLDTKCGSKWTKEEELQLLKSIRDGKTIDEIANEHKRTTRGISGKLRHISIRIMEVDNIPIEEVTISVNNIPKKSRIKILKKFRDILIRIKNKLFK